MNALRKSEVIKAPPVSSHQCTERQANNITDTQISQVISTAHRSPSMAEWLGYAIYILVDGI